MHHETTGRAGTPPLLLLHGGGVAGWMWEPLRGHLDPARRVIVPDLPGHGRSATADYVSHEETVAARQLVGFKCRITSDTRDARGQRHVVGVVDSRSTSEVTLDPDDRIVAGKCGCSYFFTGGLRKGPCRHLQALRNKALGQGEQGGTLESWFKRFTS